MDQEKRRSPRYFFFVSAELTEEDSQIRVPPRVSELYARVGLASLFSNWKAILRKTAYSLAATHYSSKFRSTYCRMPPCW
jgi:hypothetical protein